MKRRSFISSLPAAAAAAAAAAAMTARDGELRDGEYVGSIKSWNLRIGDIVTDRKKHTFVVVSVRESPDIHHIEVKLLKLDFEGWQFETRMNPVLRYIGNALSKT